MSALSKLKTGWVSDMQENSLASATANTLLAKDGDRYSSTLNHLEIF